MKNIFFSIGLFLLSATAVLAQTQLKSFDEIISALNAGQSVKAVVHYGDCMLIDGNEIQEKSPDAVGGMPLDVYEYFAEGSIGNKQAFVVSSVSKLIQNPKGKGFVYNYAKIRIDEDGKVKLTANYLSPTDYSVLMDENFFTEINNAKNEGAAYFYAQ